MRYWYHPESESLWSTEGDSVDHENSPESGNIVELTFMEFQTKLKENERIAFEANKATELKDILHPAGEHCYICGQDH